jgi:hypothetical protein
MIYFSEFGAGAAASISGVLVYHDTNQNVSAGADVLWNSESYDSASYHDVGSNTEKLTIPSGVSLGRVIVGATDNNSNAAVIYKGGASFAGTTLSSVDDAGNSASAIVAVSATNYFTVRNIAAGAHQFNAYSWMAFEPISASQKYALVQKTATQSILISTTTTITFDTEVADTDAFHDNSSNNSRLTVPSGVSRVRVSGSVEATAQSTQAVLTMLKGGAAVRGGFAKDTETTSSTTISAVSAIFAVSPGEYFEMQYFVGTARTVQNSDRTWFQIEEVDSAIKYALVYKATSQAIDGGSGFVAVNLDGETADADAMHSYASTVTITIASPGVVTWSAHGFVAGQPIVFTTSGALPTGLTAGTIYYVVSPLTNTFGVATTPIGAAINTTGSQSGVHTATNSSRLTVPAACTRARLTFNLKTPSNAFLMEAAVRKNGTTYDLAGLPRYANETSGTDSLNGFGAWIDAVPGDYFELMFNCSSLTLGTDNETWFQLECQ